MENYVYNTIWYKSTEQNAITNTTPAIPRRCADLSTPQKSQIVPVNTRALPIYRF